MEADKNKRTWESLYKQYSNMAYRRALKVLGDAATAQDIMQDSMIAAWTNRASLRGASFGPWISTISTNAAKQYLRVKETCRHGKLEYKDYQNYSSSSAETMAIVEERLERLDQVPAFDRNVFHLYTSKGYTFSEISHILNVTKTNAWKALCEVKETLAD